MSSPDNIIVSSGPGTVTTVNTTSGVSSSISAPKIALVKPTDGKGATVQAHQFRTLTQQPMRVVMPSGAVQSAGTTQIIQTHIMPQAMIKQVDALGRAQIAQSSAVTRPLTPNTIMPRGVTTVTNINAARGNIRAQTPPISNVTNIPTSFVRGAIPPRTPSPAGTVIPSGTWVAGNQPVQLIRASIGHSPRTRIVSQGIPAVSSAVSSTGLTNISANIVSSQSGQHTQTQSTGTIQTISSATTASNLPGQSQTFVATLATVLPPRQQTATLVYSNPQQFGTAGTGQRLAVANPISTQRQVRPIQISNARLPTSGLGVRVSSGNISIRGPNIPVLAPSSVLTSLPAGTSTTVTASNITAVTGLPAARIIQVQQQSPSGTTQVLNTTGRITGNLMTLHPLVMNASATSSNTVRGTATSAKPSLTITHVGKVPTTGSSNVGQQGVQLATTNLSQNATITASSTGLSHQNQQNTSASAPIGIVMGPSVNQSSGQTHQIAQIVNLNQSGINVGHQIVRKNENTKSIRTKPFLSQQIIGSQGSTNAPLTITSRPTNTSLGGTTVTTLPGAQIIRGNLSTSSNSSANNTATVLPMAKVVPQQHQQTNETATIVSVSSVGNTQNVYIHSRSPSNPTVSNIAVSNIVNSQTGSIISAPSGTFYMPVSSTTATLGGNAQTLHTVTTNSASVSTNVPLNTTTLTSYAPQPGSFAVVPASNRGIISSTNLTSTTSSVPVRFNPPLIDHSTPSGAIISVHQSQANQIPIQGSQKQNHVLLPTSNAKAVVVTASTRPQIVTTTGARKRDLHGEIVTVPIPNQIPLTKNAVKNLNSALESLRAEQQPGQLQRASSPISRPGSSDGSTTVSAHSSPGVDRQEQEEFNIVNPLHRNNRNIADGAQFATSQTVNVPQMQANSSAVYVQGGHIVSGFRTQGANVSAQNKSFQITEVQTSIRNGNADDLTPRKRARKQQFNEYLNSGSKKFQPSSPASAFGNESNIIHDSDDSAFNRNADTTSIASESEGPIIKIENNDSTSNAALDSSSKNVDIVIKKPRSCTLLDGYKQSWKATNNHFQRYSDVKPREERKPTVVDLANQAHVLQKVNGWKIYHLTSQMEDLTELEVQVYDKLSSMLQCMEAHNQSSDVDRVNDLIKGNMQRSKIVSDSINDARLQILKVFDHKSHVSDIIHRCASKRNFKKKF